ncbi:hypothetical protein CHARACLAT_011902 [Characodon lateralis]|uniref:Uncharacterized protein n=1 Tax=Characodon lateralis TaxID=208331 RepID=A0ABU7DI15_9TELE|nr:hypothetical protein [Characodon lateralis]
MTITFSGTSVYPGPSSLGDESTSRTPPTGAASPLQNACPSAFVSRREAGAYLQQSTGKRLLVASLSQGNTQTTMHTLIHTPKGNLERPINLTGMFLDCGRKPEYLRVMGEAGGYLQQSTGVTGRCFCAAVAHEGAITLGFKSSGEPERGASSLSHIAWKTFLPEILLNHRGTALFLLGLVESSAF